MSRSGVTGNLAVVDIEHDGRTVASGRELYRALGWRVVAGQFGVNRPPLSR